jgi:hypothetical protein
LFFPATILDGRRLSLKEAKLATVSVRTPAAMLGQPGVFGSCPGGTEQVDLDRILGVHRGVLLISCKC